MKQDCQLIVFAKAPVPGYAKTRLARELGDEGAARLASRTLAHTLDCALAADVGPVELCCAPDTSHAQFQRAAARPGVRLSSQGDGDLGERMERALHRALELHAAAVLIGTDAPALDAAALRRAADALRAHDAVLVPASDGGYALIGLSRRIFGLFCGVAWSTGKVMSQTRERIEALGLSHVELATVHDIDEPEDLVHLPVGWLS